MVQDLTETNTDNSVRVTRTTYAIDIIPAYADMKTRNMLSQVAQQTVYITSVSTSNARSSSVTTWKEWPAGSGKWAPCKTYRWKEDDASYSLPTFDFTNWSDGTEPTELEWIKTLKVRLRDGYGNVLEAEDANETKTTTKWGYNSSLPIATVVNARTSQQWLGSECGYIGFESGKEDNMTNPDEDYWGFYSVNEHSNHAHTGRYSRKLTPDPVNPRYGPTKDFRPPDLAGQQRVYVASCWIKTESGFGSGKAQLVLHSKRDDDDNNNTYPVVEGAYKVASVGDTQGQWVYVELELDLKTIRQLGGILDNQLLRLRVYPVSYDDNKYMLVDDIRVYPKDAVMTTQTYDPNRFQVTSQTDAVGVATSYGYDNFGRLVYTLNDEGKLLSQTSFYFSRDGNGGNFNASDPNYIRQVVSQSDGLISNFSAETAPQWTVNNGTWAVENGEYSQSNTTSDNTNSYRAFPQSGKQYYRWKISFISGSTMAGVHIMASDGSQSQRGNSYLIWQSSSIIRLYESVNNSLYTRKDFSLPAQNGETHIYEVLYDAGRLDIWRDGKYAGNWTDSTPLTSGSYISLRTNATHAHFDDVIVQKDPAITTTFSDGLGREFQNQTWNGSFDIISKTTYNNIGKVDKQYKPQEISNPTHTYYSSLTGLYELFEYFGDPLARLKKQTHMGGVSSINYNYTSELFNGFTYRYEQITDETGKISRNYFDKFGNAVGGRAAIGTAKEIKWVNDYDILGNVTTIKPPNFWSPPSGTVQGDWDSQNSYDTLTRLTQKSTPDEGTTKFIYDNNDNPRYKQDAAQVSGGDFTVYYYDKHNRITLVGVELDDFNWTSSPPSVTNTTYGTEANEWKAKYYYDVNYVTGLTNYCQGKLTKTEMNDDTDATAEHITTYVYDKFGNLTEKRIVIDGGSPITEKLIQNSYDLQGRETQLVYPSGNTVVRQYDSLGRLKKIYTIN